MAKVDWTVMQNSIDGPTWNGVTVLRASTYGAPNPPPGGGDSVFAFNSLEIVEGAVGVSCTISGFAPLSSGGRIQGALLKGLSGGTGNFSVALFILANANSVQGEAYMLGLEMSDPARIVLAKGKLNGGLHPDRVRFLRTSQRRVNIDEWVHLRLDAIVQGSGDVILRAYENNIYAHPLDQPSTWVWEPIVFDDDFNGRFPDGYFIDDSVGANSGSVPLTSGYVGFVYATKDVARRAFVDHISIYSQA